MMKKLTATFASIPFLILILTFNCQSATAQAVNYEAPLSAKEDGIGFMLEWSTFDDSNTSLFVIERSKEGQEFESIGTLKGKQSKNLSKYNFKDLELGLTNVRYRLREVQADGGSSFTEAISLNKEFVSYFEVVNKEKVTEEVMEITINSVKEVELECRITNNMGNILMEELRKINVGLNDVVFDLTSEPDGTYHMIFKQDNVMETAVFKKDMKDKKSNVAKKKTDKNGG